MVSNFDAKITAIDAANVKGHSVQAIHKELKNKKLQSSKSHNRVFFGHNTARELFNYKFDNNVFTFQVVKGGTGKTSIAHSFAIRAHLYGAKVLCIDLDQQGNLSSAFNVDCRATPVMIDIINGNSRTEDAIVEISEGLSILPSRIDNAVLDNYLMVDKHPLDRVYRDLLEEVRYNFDIIVIDCPPALGQSVTAAALASDVIICPVTPEQFSISGLEVSYQEIHTIKKRFKKDVDLKIVLNKFDTRTALSNEVLTSILNHKVYKTIMCNTFIRSSQDFPNMIYNGSNIFANIKASAAKEDIDLLTKELLNISNG